MRAAKRRRRRSDHLVAPRHWKLWRVPPPFLILVLAVDAAAVATIALTASLYPASESHLRLFLLLAGLSVLHLEFTRRVERVRELVSEGTLYVNFKSIWTFAGLLLLPPSLVAALVVLTYTHSWLRVGRAILPHRWIFSASTVVLASAAGGAVLALAYPASYPTLPAGWGGLVVIAAAALARWAVNSALVFVAMPLMSSSTTWRQAGRAVFGTPGDDLIEFVALSLGVLVAKTLLVDPAFVLFLALPLLMMQWGLQFEQAAERDRETGVLRLELWRELATKQLERAARLRTAVGYLFVRLDEVDASLAEVADNRIGRLIAEAIRAEVRDTDLVGRLPGAYDFAVLVADVPDGDLGKVAERIRRAVAAIRIAVDTADGPAEVGGLTVSIGGASYPSPARTLPELMMCADNALILAKSFVRDEVSIVGPDDTPANTR